MDMDVRICSQIVGRYANVKTFLMPRLSLPSGVGRMSEEVIAFLQ